MAAHQHDSDAVLPNLRGWTREQRIQAAQRLVRQLDAKNGSGHVSKVPDIDRVLLLVDVLEATCRCGRSIGGQLGIDMNDIDPTASVARTDGPHKGTYLHNLWHLLWD